jgi:hypothetical protein
MLALLNGKATIVTVYYWVALLCSGSTGGSCYMADIADHLFISKEQCEGWIRDEWLAQRLSHDGKYDCKHVRYSIDIGHPYEGAQN